MVAEVVVTFASGFGTVVDVHFPSVHFVVVQPMFEQIVVVALPPLTEVEL